MTADGEDVAEPSFSIEVGSGCDPCGASAGCRSTTSSGSPAAAGAPPRSAPTSAASAT